ncbi:MAG: CHASE2 domain-containing protein [Rhodospirillaceae bacterium]|nr:CHASE2 domain-containing protein [Rhodospirillaceae bacterium]
MPGPARSSHPVLQAWRARSRPIGVLAGVVFAALIFFTAGTDEGPTAGIRRVLFDLYHEAIPRPRISGPVTIVAIDEASLAAVGQWPWPRDRIAALIDAIAVHKPAAVGVDILFSEPDRLSAESADWAKGAPQAVEAWLALRPPNDAVLAQAIANAPVALGIAGLEETAGGGTAGQLAPVRVEAGVARDLLRPYNSLLRSLPVIDAAARGHGLLSADPDPDGVIRRVYLMARTSDLLVPSLDLEMLRLAANVGGFNLDGDERGVSRVRMGDLGIPMQRDGSVWLHFGRHDPGRFVSAVDVLAGTADAAMLESKLVLIGVTGLGLMDQPSTPLTSRMAGVEIRAQVLESVFDGTLLSRPDWAPAVEALITLLLCCGLAFAMPAMQPRYAALPYAGSLAALAAGGLIAFGSFHLLLDVLSPALAAGVVFVGLLEKTLAEADQQRQSYKRDLEIQRIRDAKLAGELAAARRIQLGSLPDPRNIVDKAGRIDVAAMLEPARQVGGDLYDMFKIDGDHLFFMIGDVSGKGIPASIFMTLGKALYKSAVLRRRQDIGEIMSEANADIARDNTESMFITAFAALLDLRDGTLNYCNAGHDPPLLLSAGHAPIPLDGQGGPPLCVLEDMTYPAEAQRIAPGDVLVLFTDGVTEAMDAGQHVYGAARLRTLLAHMRPKASAQQIVEAIYDDVKRHSGDAEPSDDIAIVVVKWNGPNDT